MKAGRCARVLALIALLGAARAAPADHLDHLFPFRFLTPTLPAATAERDYSARVLTINSYGPVSFSATGLPAGLALDAVTGEITGRPAAAGSYPVDVLASDGETPITLAGVVLDVAEAPPGPAPAEFALDSLPEARVGVAYDEVLSVAGGVGPFTFGAEGLPEGLRLDGRTGRIHGTPDTPGTFRVVATLRDDGAAGSSSRVFPLVVYPPGSQFRFVTRALNPIGNYYSYNRLETAGATGAVTFAAPPGYLWGVNPTTGYVGVDFEFLAAGAGTVVFTASDGTDTIRAELPFHVLVSNYDFHWETDRLPVAFVGVPYGQGAPVRLSTANAPGPVSFWKGDLLPPGMEFDGETGILSGVPTRAGLYRPWFSADFGPTQDSPGETTALVPGVLVLPTGGGDASSIAVNYCPLWQRVREEADGRTSWSGAAIWNGDRRARGPLDSLGFPVVLRLGPLGLYPYSDGRRRAPGGWNYRTPAGEPEFYGRARVSARVSHQSLRWHLRDAEETVALPAAIDHTAIIGSGNSFARRLEFGGDGIYRDEAAPSPPAFVVSRGRIDAAGGTLALHGLLRDDGNPFEPGETALRVRVLDGVREVVSRDFTDLARGLTEVDPDGGEELPRIRTDPDHAGASRVAAFRFHGYTGRFDLRMDRLATTGLPRDEAHLGVELTIGDRVYFTAVTFFERSRGDYRTTGTAK